MPIIGKQTPRGTTSFYDFSRNEEAQQPVAAAPQENGATTSEEEKKQNVSPSLPNDDDAYAAFRKTLPVNLRDTKDADYEQGGDYRSRRYWELNGKPKDFNEGLKNNMFTKEDDGFYHSHSVAFNKEKDEYEFMKSKNHPTVGMELDWYNGDKDGAPEFRKNYMLDKSGDYYRYVRRNAPVANGAPVNTTPEQQQYQSDVDKMVQWQQNTEAQRRADEQAQTPVATKNGNSSSASSSNASSTSTKTTTTTVSPYEPFKGDNLGDLADYIEKERDRVKPETDEEREKREKREKRLDFLSRLRDGLSTFHTAYSYARGVKPMDLTMMSPRARELFEKAKRERDKDADRRLNLTLVLQNLKDKERAWKYNVTKDETARADRQAAAAAQAEQAAAALKEQQRQHDDKMDLERGKAAQQAAQAAGELQEKVRHNKEDEAAKKRDQNIRQQEVNIRKQAQDTSQYYTLGEGKGMVKIPKNAVNTHNFSAINSSLPKEYRAVGKPQTRTTTNPTTGKQEQEVIGYAAPTTQDMLVAVGAFLGDESIPANEKTVVRAALSQLGTANKSSKKTMPGVK
jgi:hypothetical protein